MPSSSHGSRLGHRLQHECQTAIGSLAAAGGDVHVRVHEARKAIRRARALIALVASELDVEAADTTLQRVGDSLGPLRDAQAVTLVARRLGKRPRATGWKQVAGALERRADRLADRELKADPGFANRRRAILRVARQLESLPWHALGNACLREGLARQGRSADKAARRAEKDPAPENLHRWRRRVRRLRMQVEALDGLEVRILDHDPALSKRLHRLGDALGEHQDRLILAETLRRMRTLDGRRELLSQLETGGVRVPGTTSTARRPPRSPSGSSSGKSAASATA